MAAKYELLAMKIAQHGITPIYEKAFGYLSHLDLFTNTRADLYRAFGFPPDRIPFSYIQGAPAMRGARWAGVHIYGIRVQEPSKVEIKDVAGRAGCYGKIIDSTCARQVFLTLSGEDKKDQGPVDEKAEIENVFTNLKSSLHNTGFRTSDLSRTWFHLRDILPVYDTFNKVRKNSYAGKVDNGCLPASTAIQGESAFGRAISLDATAIRTMSPKGPIVRTMTSPIQPEAKTYGPLFSRGIEIKWPDYKILYISGTASIDQAGRSVYLEPEPQIRNTLNNISLLLNKYGASMNNIVHACAYFKNEEDLPLFNNILEQNYLSNMPCLQLVGDICRHDLLFEMDCIGLVQLSGIEAY